MHLLLDFWPIPSYVQARINEIIILDWRGKVKKQIRWNYIGNSGLFLSYCIKSKSRCREGSAAAGDLLFNQLDIFDDGLVAGVDRAVVIIGLGIGTDGINDLHTFCNSAECGIVAVQELGIFVADEELGRGGIIAGGLAGHGDNTAGMGEIVFETVGAELALDDLTAAALAIAVGIAALDHKASIDTVEGQAVVKALVDQVDKIVDGDGGNIGIQLHEDGTVIFDRHFGIVLAADIGDLVIGHAGDNHKDDDADHGNDTKEDIRQVSLGMVLTQNNSSFPIKFLYHTKKTYRLQPIEKAPKGLFGALEDLSLGLAGSPFLEEGPCFGKAFVAGLLNIKAQQLADTLHGGAAAEDSDECANAELTAQDDADGEGTGLHQHTGGADREGQAACQRQHEGVTGTGTQLGGQVEVHTDAVDEDGDKAERDLQPDLGDLGNEAQRCVETDKQVGETADEQRIEDGADAQLFLGQNIDHDNDDADGGIGLSDGDADSGRKAVIEDIPGIEAADLLGQRDGKADGGQTADQLDKAEESFFHKGYPHFLYLSPNYFNKPHRHSQVQG